jgi:PASTA domain
VPNTELKPEDRRAADELIARNGAAAEGERVATPARAEGERVAAKNSVESVAPATLPESVRREGEIKEVVYARATERALLMPDVRGRSVRDAMRVCAQLGLELEALGEGRAVRQEPAAGSRVEAGQKVRIEFGRSD